MADKREAYAGDLTSDVIGKRVKVRTMRGEPVIDAIQHYRNTKTEQTRTVVWFENGSSTELADTELVEVLPASAMRVASGSLVCSRDGAAFDTVAALEAHVVAHPAPNGGDAA